MNTTALKRAVQQVMAALAEGEGEDMRKGMAGPARVEVEMEGGKCPACEDGTCEDPDHMDAGALEGYGGE